MPPSPPGASPPATRNSLILRLPNAADSAAWEEVVQIYGPLVFRLARKQGLQGADAEDLVQEVFTAVSKQVEQWLQRTDHGPFRAWVLRIARNIAVNVLTRRPLGAGSYLIEVEGDDTSFVIKGNEVSLSRGESWIARIDLAQEQNPVTQSGETHQPQEISGKLLSWLKKCRHIYAGNGQIIHIGDELDDQGYIDLRDALMSLKGSQLEHVQFLPMSPKDELYDQFRFAGIAGFIDISDSDTDNESGEQIHNILERLCTESNKRRVVSEWLTEQGITRDEINRLDTLTDQPSLPRDPIKSIIDDVPEPEPTDVINELEKQLKLEHNELTQMYGNKAHQPFAKFSSVGCLITLQQSNSRRPAMHSLPCSE